VLMTVTALGTPVAAGAFVVASEPAPGPAAGVACVPGFSAVF